MQKQPTLAKNAHAKNAREEAKSWLHAPIDVQKDKSAKKTEVGKAAAIRAAENAMKARARCQKIQGKHRNQTELKLYHGYADFCAEAVL